MKKESIVVISCGFVGKAIINLVKKHYQVYCYDPAYHAGIKYQDLDEVIFLKTIEEHPDDAVLGIVCAPTPSTPDGSCDLQYVENALHKLKTPLIMIKSTIEVGTTDMLKKTFNKRIVFSPEFVGESKYYNPYFNDEMATVPWLVLGGDPKDTRAVLEIMVKILGPTKRYYQCPAKEAEMIKYVENVFFATKVTFCNEIYEICEKAGMDYWKVREGWLLDPRVGGDGMHTAVFNGNRGYAGKCFNKDTRALAKLAEKVGYNPELLKEVIKTNDKFRRMNSPEQQEQDRKDLYGNWKN
jgi:nucleotide sugar dehydrogenase